MDRPPAQRDRAQPFWSPGRVFRLALAVALGAFVALALYDLLFVTVGKWLHLAFPCDTDNNLCGRSVTCLLGGSGGAAAGAAAGANGSGKGKGKGPGGKGKTPPKSPEYHDPQDPWTPPPPDWPEDWKHRYIDKQDDMQRHPKGPDALPPGIPHPPVDTHPTSTPTPTPAPGPYETVGNAIGSYHKK